ncbi:MAG: excisionase family protein [Vibrio sp.]
MSPEEMKDFVSKLLVALVNALPGQKWYGGEVVMATFSMSNTDLSNYRQTVWPEKKLWKKVGTSGRYSHGKAKIMYNMPELQKWIDEYPTM